MFIFASPWFWGGVASLFSGVLGWVTGFFGSESIKTLAWAALFLSAAIAFYFVMQLVNR
ncbi:MAG: hypothetical protein ACRBBR_00675 [Cellvibrionaceae bacterium]